MRMQTKAWNFRQVLLLGTAAIALGAWPASAADWPCWRGPEQTGMSREEAPVTEWTPEGRNLAWKSEIGGRSTPIVMDGRVFLIAPVGEGIMLGERVVCLDARTGNAIWEHRFNVFHTDIVENRVGWTAVCGDPETGNIYAHGTGGEMFCFSRDGDVVWKRSLTEEFGRISGYGGRLHTPIVDENRVIVSFLNSSWGPQARPTHRYLALDKHTGDVIWWAEPGDAPEDTTYAVPAVAVVDGKRLLIAPTADGNVYGMLARTGEKVWTFRLSKRGLNSSVVVRGNHAYVCHSEENLDNTFMGRVVCIDASKTGDITESGEVWRTDGVDVGYASPALAGDRLYVVTNDAELICYDADTGKRHWNYDLGRVGKGSPTVTRDGVIYVGEQNGIFHILRDAGDKCVPLDRHEFERDDGLVVEIFGSPAIADGRVYFMTRYATYSLGQESASGPVEVAMPNMPAENPAPDLARLTIVPAEVTVAPGESVDFRAYYTPADSTARREVKASWSVVGLNGNVGSSGTFLAGDEPAFSAGTVVARVIPVELETKVGEVNAPVTTDQGRPAGMSRMLEAAARVRVCPRLPFSVDFESMPVGSVPPGWIGITRKAEVVEFEGNKVLKKLARKEFPSPPFMRVRTYLTLPIEGGYTMQCDVLGTPKGKIFKPDMGLINSRYRLVLLGMGNKLRLESWAALPRLREEVPFDFETDKWYTMKFAVTLDDGKARLRGKVWPRDESEPSAWNIEAVDPLPNTEGSPGLYAYSPGTTAKSDGPEVYFDNLRVMPHE